MQHPKLTKALAALDDARTEVSDVLKAGIGTGVEQRYLQFELNTINRLILLMPHIKTEVNSDV